MSTESTLITLDPEELRIGNLVYGGVTNALCLVYEIQKDESGNIEKVIAKSLNGNDYWMLFGVPLDASRLIKLGFIQYEKDGCKFHHNWIPIEVTYNQESKFWYFDGIRSKRVDKRISNDGHTIIYPSVFMNVHERLHFLHEFQNLYHEITGIDLIVSDLLITE